MRSPGIGPAWNLEHLPSRWVTGGSSRVACWRESPGRTRNRGGDCLETVLPKCPIHLDSFGFGGAPHTASEHASTQTHPRLSINPIKSISSQISQMTPQPPTERKRLLSSHQLCVHGFLPHVMCLSMKPHTVLLQLGRNRTPRITSHKKTNRMY